MKKLMYLFSVATSSCFAQEGDTSQVITPVLPPAEGIIIYEEASENDEVGDIIDFPDIEAKFPGGTRAMQLFVAENVVYPMKAIKNNEQGSVYLSFIVEPTGKITHITVERGVSKALDAEAKRIIKKMPRWSPGGYGDTVVRTRCRLPIVFTLEDGDEPKKKKKGRR